MNAVIDFIGKPYFGQIVQALQAGGRLVQVGLIGGHDTVELPLDVLLYRHLKNFGTVMKSRTQTEKRAMTHRFAERWLAHFDGQRLTPVIDSVLPLDEAADAHRRMEAGDMFGKVILQVPVFL